MTYQNPQYPAQPFMTPPRTSGLAIAALICSLLFCIPVITSAVGVLLALIAFVVTGRPNVKGRGLAIAALLIGLLGLVGWGYAGYWIKTYAIDPTRAVTSFSQDLSQGNTAAASAMTVAPFDNATIPVLTAKLATLGKFIELEPGQKGKVPFGMKQKNGQTVFFGAGILRFANGRQACDIELQKTASGWKVTKFDMTDAPLPALGTGVEDYSDKPTTKP